MVSTQAQRLRGGGTAQGGPGPRTPRRPRRRRSPRAGAGRDRAGCAGPARVGCTQRTRRPGAALGPAPGAGLASYAANMAEALPLPRPRPGPARAALVLPLRRPPASGTAGLQAVATPPARLPRAGPAATRLPAAGRGERSGSGRSPNRSMAEAGRWRGWQTRSPRAAAGPTRGGSALHTGGGGSDRAAAARAPSINRRRAQGATNRRAARPGRPRVLCASEAGRRGGGARPCARAQAPRLSGPAALTRWPPCCLRRSVRRFLFSHGGGVRFRRGRCRRKCLPSTATVVSPDVWEGAALRPLPTTAGLHSCPVLEAGERRLDRAALD